MSEAEDVEKIKSESSEILSEIVNYNFLMKKGSESERDTEEECQLLPLDEEARCPYCDYVDPALSDAISLAEDSSVTEWKCPSCDENYRVTALRPEDKKLAEADTTLTDDGWASLDKGEEKQFG